MHWTAGLIQQNSHNLRAWEDNRAQRRLDTVLFVAQNPDGSLSQAAMMQSALQKERRELKQQERESEMSQAPTGLNKNWVDPMPGIIVCCMIFSFWTSLNCQSSSAENRIWWKQNNCGALMWWNFQNLGTNV